MRRAIKGLANVCFGALAMSFAAAPPIGAAELPTRVQDIDASFLGVNAIWPPGSKKALQQRFERARSLGVTHLRIGWEWRQVEQKPGSYNWAAMDRLVRLAQEHNLKLLPVVHFPPSWATVDESKPQGAYELAPSPKAYDDYADFLAASIQRYGPNGDTSFEPIRQWQVWNEPNNDDFWAPETDPQAWVDFMKVVDQRLDEGGLRDDLKLVHAGLSKADFAYLWKLWEKDTDYGERFDVMAVHPYMYNWQDGVRHPTAMDEDVGDYAELGFVGSPHKPGFLGKVFNLQRLIKYRVGETRPIWITEVGFFVGDQKLGVSAQRQATLLRETVKFVTRRLTSRPYGDGRRDLPTRVTRLYWFGLEDYPAPSGRGTFGLYTDGGKRRPAARTFSKLLQ